MQTKKSVLKKPVHKLTDKDKIVVEMGANDFCEVLVLWLEHETKHLNKKKNH